jgi:uncharacterized protein RhaS with RHS repeats
VIGREGAPHRLTAVNGSAIAYDADGNRTEKPGQNYGYDNDDHLTRSASGPASASSPTPSGRRSIWARGEHVQTEHTQSEYHRWAGTTVKEGQKANATATVGLVQAAVILPLMLPSEDERKASGGERREYGIEA